MKASLLLKLFQPEVLPIVLLIVTVYLVIVLTTQLAPSLHIPQTVNSKINLSGTSKTLTSMLMVFGPAYATVYVQVATTYNALYLSNSGKCSSRYPAAINPTMFTYSAQSEHTNSRIFFTAPSFPCWFYCTNLLFTSKKL